MGKPKTLPLTKAETAEKRLEEITKNKSMTRYTIIFQDYSHWFEYPKDGEVRLYHDGLEALLSNSQGVLYVERRRLFVNYDLEKEYEKQGKD